MFHEPLAKRPLASSSPAPRGKTSTEVSAHVCVVAICRGVHHAHTLDLPVSLDRDDGAETAIYVVARRLGLLW